MGGGPLLRRNEGSATVEFFLVLPLAFMVLVGGLQLVSVVRAKVELSGAAREGARVAATTPDPARAVAAVESALPRNIRGRARVSVERPSVAGKPARVTITARHDLGAPFPDGFGVELSSSAVMAVER